MSLRAWRRYAQTVAILSVLILLVGATWLLWGSWEPTPYRSTHGEEFNTSERYQYQPDPGCSPQELRRLPSAVDRENKRRECANQATDHRREVDDLTQQTRAAEAVEEANWFARANFTLAKIQFVLAIFGALALAVSLYLTWRAIAATREIGEAQVRAYLSLERAIIYARDNDEFAIDVVVRNHGQSPALNVHYVVEFPCMVEGKAASEKVFFYSSTGEIGAISAEAAKGSGRVGHESVSVPPGAIRNREGRVIVPVARIGIFASDVFGCEIFQTETLLVAGSYGDSQTWETESLNRVLPPSRVVTSNKELRLRGWSVGALKEHAPKRRAD